MQTKTLILCGGLAVATTLALSSCGKSDSGSAASPSATKTADAPKATEATKAAVPAGEQEEIKPTYPKPMFVGTPVPPGDVANLEEPVGEDKIQKSFMAPKGTTNVALGKKVTSSDTNIVIPGPDSLKLLTDGDADSSDGCFVELAPDPQWVQIDLEKDFDISKIIVWHFHRQAVIVKGVVVQISDDPEFKTGVNTVYNADIEDACKQGKGTDKAWVQTNHGRMIDGKNTKGRYVRLWSNGSTMDDFNRYIEISVYGTPAK
ncbi:MAG: coagulation factor 5/8 type domain protein [Verrucomicrobiaceae bacterium]|nr:coagulation factor 5/8 type domain protein [Verrucomicrobiaceae bacterium]